MKRSGGKTFRSAIKWIFLILFAFVTCFFLFACATVLNLDAWNSFDPEKILGASESSIFYDDNDNEIFRLHGVEDRISISLEGLPDHVPYAFVSAEDARFYEHNGIDLIRIAGAAWEDIKAGGYVQGASTISQQLIKLSHLSAEKTMSRKLEEAILAYRMEQQYSKNEIMTMYLNYVYFGGGYYGIESASLGYFGIHANELSIAQAALLAGILKAPSNYAPHLDLDASIRRRNMILGLMKDYGYISEDEMDKARAESVELVHGKESNDFASYYIETAIREAASILGIDREALYTGGYRIYTALDSELQRECESIFSDDSLFPEKNVQSAIVVQYANSGLVPALLGGRNAESSAFNRATDIRRQPGSVIKPVLCYAPALESGGFTAASMLLDEKTTFGDYSPDNFGSKYYGWVTMREAVTRSLNVPAVKVLSELGVENAKQFAQTLGISFDKTDKSLTLALGGFSYGVSPWMISGAYNSFASGGNYYKPTVIREIRTNGDELLYAYEDQSVKTMSEQNAYILTSMLQSVVSEGTGRRLGELDIKLAGKTGTVDESEGNRDAWMAAYNPEYTASVWMGYDSSADGYLPEAATGGKYPALILQRLFSFLYKDKEAPDFVRPHGIVEERLDSYSLRYRHTAALATAFTPPESIYTEVFAEGTQPSDTSLYWTVPLPPAGFSVGKNTEGYPLISFRPRESYVQYKLFRQKDGGIAECVSVFSGNENVAYVDYDVDTGKEYSYYVIAVHPEMSVNGRQAESARTMSYDIEIPSLLYEEKQESLEKSESSDGVIDLTGIIN